MIDPSTLIGRELPRFSTVAERRQIQFFADVVGEDDPTYLDVDAARAAGYPDVPVPPTFLFTLELRRPDPYQVLRELDVDMRQVLHGEQWFAYHRTACAGEELDFAPRITDYYEKKNGALRFLVRETNVSRRGETIADLTNVIVIRRLELVS